MTRPSEKNDCCCASVLCSVEYTPRDIVSYTAYNKDTTTTP